VPDTVTVELVFVEDSRNSDPFTKICTLKNGYGANEPVIGVASSERNTGARSVRNVSAYGRVLVVCESPSSAELNRISTVAGVPDTRYSTRSRMTAGAGTFGEGAVEG
jgi:hypothetical protein